jgi:hypothetical protein
MIKIEKYNGFYDSCQVCHNMVGIFDISFSDGRLGTEIHLCKDCCKELRSLLKFTMTEGMKFVSIDNIDK